MRYPGIPKSYYFLIADKMLMFISILGFFVNVLVFSHSLGVHSAGVEVKVENLCFFPEPFSVWHLALGQYHSLNELRLPHF